mgnify:FL=1
MTQRVIWETINSNLELVQKDTRLQKLSLEYMKVYRLIYLPLESSSLLCTLELHPFEPPKLMMVFTSSSESEDMLIFGNCIKRISQKDSTLSLSKDLSTLSSVHSQIEGQLLSLFNRMSGLQDLL